MESNVLFLSERVGTEEVISAERQLCRDLEAWEQRLLRVHQHHCDFLASCECGLLVHHHHRPQGSHNLH